MAYILPQKDFVFRDGGSGYIEASLKDSLLSNLLRTNSLKIYDHIVRQVYLIDGRHLKIRIMRVRCVKTQKTHIILPDIVDKFKRYSRATIALALARIIDPSFLDSTIKCICSKFIRKDLTNIVRLFCIECRNCISSWIKDKSYLKSYKDKMAHMRFCTEICMQNHSWANCCNMHYKDESMGLCAGAFFDSTCFMESLIL